VRSLCDIQQSQHDQYLREVSYRSEQLAVH